MNHNVWEDGFFKIDPECHIIGDMEPINHFPGVQMWWRAIDGIMRPTIQGAPKEYMGTLEPWELQKSTDPENILRAMDKYGVDVACILPESMMDTTGYSSRWCTNGDAWKAVQTHPDRFIINPNISPIKKRGAQNAIWEMEYWVDKGAKIFKYYSPEDTCINDPELWPFYKRAEELGIVLCLHSGFSWVPPGKSKYCYSTQIDDVARDFPELNIVAFHMGYPFTDAMNMVALGHPNVYLCLSLLVPWAISAPYKFAHILGEAIRFVGPDRIIWGTDSAGYGAQIGAAAVGLTDFKMPEELQWQYGYLPLSDEDKRKIFGGNLDRLLGIDTSRRRGGANPATDSLNAHAQRIVVNTPKTESKEASQVADNQYDVVISTPMGDMDGKVTLNVDGDKLSGTIYFMKNENAFTGGTIDADGNVAFKGELKTPIGKMAYTITGTFVNGQIDAVAKTRMGDLAIKSNDRGGAPMPARPFDSAGMYGRKGRKLYMNRIRDNLGSIIVCLIEIIAGILLLINPIGLTTSIIVIAGIALTVAGIYWAIRYFRADAIAAAANQYLVKGLLAMSGGIFCIARSGWFLAAFPVLTLLYGVITLIVGLFKLQFTVDKLRLKAFRWGWSALSTALTLLVAVIILLDPFSSTMVLWTFIAVAMIVEAALDIVGIALACRRG